MRPFPLLVAAAVSAFAASAQLPVHPLDGLSAREHWTIYDVLVASGKTDTTTRYLANNRANIHATSGSSHRCATHAQHGEQLST